MDIIHLLSVEKCEIREHDFIMANRYIDENVERKKTNMKRNIGEV